MELKRIIMLLSEEQRIEELQKTDNQDLRIALFKCIDPESEALDDLNPEAVPRAIKKEITADDVSRQEIFKSLSESSLEGARARKAALTDSNGRLEMEAVMLYKDFVSEGFMKQLIIAQPARARVVRGPVSRSASSYKHES